MSALWALARAVLVEVLTTLAVAVVMRLIRRRETR